MVELCKLGVLRGLAGHTGGGLHRMKWHGMPTVQRSMSGAGLIF